MLDFPKRALERALSSRPFWAAFFPFVLFIALAGILLAVQPLLAETEKAEKRLWCEEHKIYEDQCLLCHPELREKGRLWCNEHGRYEDRCWLCHPELRDEARAYCETHFLYADECAHLHGKTQAAVHAPPSEQRVSEQSLELFCKEHELPEAECGICHPELLSDLRDARPLKLRLASEDSAKLINLKTVQPERGTLSSAVRSLGELRFNENKTAHIVAPVKGVIKAVHADLGSSVVAGEPLVSLWSPAIAEAASKAVLAEQTLTRVERLRAKGITSGRELEHARAESIAALQRLQSLGFTSSQIAALKESSEAPVVLEVAAPFAAEIVERHSVQGEFVEAGAPLFTLSDRSLLWAMLSIPAAEISLVSVGQRVEVTTSHLPDEEFHGRITWVSASIDSKTRMATVRAEIPNPGGRLRHNMFVEGRIFSEDASETFLIPSHAVHTIEEIDFVFVRLADDLFQIQPVQTGSRSGEQIQILAGLTADQVVVSERSHVLKSQFLISRLGAGCVH